MADDQAQSHLRASEPPSCPDCTRAMRLVGSEDAADGAELLTFACDCGQILTTTTGH